MEEVARLFTTHRESSIPINALYEQDTEAFFQHRSKRLKIHAENMNFSGKENQILIIPLPDGKIERILFGLGRKKNARLFGCLSKKLPAGLYRISSAPEEFQFTEIALFWGLGLYRFSTYLQKTSSNEKPCLVLPETINQTEIIQLVHAGFWVRDLINMPGNDLGPKKLAMTVKELANKYQAKTEIIKEKTLQREYPLIHAVGKASDEMPRLVKMEWSGNGDAEIILIGKGVCFDSGGVDLKSAHGMRMMKKDMGGAAHAMALAYLIMDSKLDVKIKLFIPCVENAVSGSAFRPGDIIKSRKGIQVEIDNTDAEGRLILADCLAEASEQKPDLVIDFATLTGAARIALGPSLSPYFTNRDHLAHQLEQSADLMNDPVWRLPLWSEYNHYLKTNIADIKNSDSSGMAGSITAALFLQRFIEEDIPWIHFDIYGWNLTDKPASPKGGEVMALFSVYHMIKSLYASKKTA